MSSDTEENAHEMMIREFASYLHDYAEFARRNGMSSTSIEALAGLIDKLGDVSDMQMCNFDRVCNLAIREANKALGELYYTPDEVLNVVEEYVLANPPMSKKGDGDGTDAGDAATVECPHGNSESVDEVIDALSQYSIRELPHEHEEAVNGYVDRAVDAIGRERDMWKQKLNDAHEVGQGFLNALNDVLDKICYAKQKKEKDCPSTKDKEK